MDCWSWDIDCRDVKIADDIIKYAKDKNVAILKRIPIGVTPFSTEASDGLEDDAIKTNTVKFTKAFPISQSINKMTSSDLYKSQQTEGEKSGSNVYGDKVQLDWKKR